MHTSVSLFLTFLYSNRVPEVISKQLSATTPSIKLVLNVLFSSIEMNGLLI